ncbi:major facilitator superfamily MFS_1 [Pirellula staleyi DSM 6068]|uniref:Major facilitator superfamily MFS_1 n=1 Tax=Pirellula staleyi (strain ATCC 27377 / DSM 6068 / ICPB 4128) TaxID=530564 RepID=D2QYC7_PIRSD|nr:MFS transporter [Pirellula staleyi]ADB16341.1 major facilitator superfamily MFS_1 [Pirellula staleyi DSM 6068]
MHGFEDQPTSLPDDPNDKRPWYLTLTKYHWFVLLVAALGWLFDCLDQQLFVLARPAVMASLVKPLTPEETEKETTIRRSNAGNIATSVFLAGWALGGVFFGVLGDRIGRAKTMMITILLYSLFTGLSALSVGVYDFALYRFLTGLGVGGEFAVGIALVAEVMPARARPYALGMLQALSAIGNVTAAFINLGLGVAEEAGMPYSPWRIMFCIGALPALLALVIRGRLKEPEQWQKANTSSVVSSKSGSYAELFGHPVWRKHALLGLLLACSGVIGLWAVGFFAPDLMRVVQRPEITRRVYETKIAEAKAAGETAKVADLELLMTAATDTSSNLEITPALKPLKEEADKSISGQLAKWGSYTSLMINFGAFFGMFGFGYVAQIIGRRPTFVIAFIAAFLSTAAVFAYLKDFNQLFLLAPLMGFCQLSLFAGYAIYFPELFPTHLRSTGTSFCYNVGRFLAAGGPLVKSYLEGLFVDTSDPLRYAGVAMCTVFLVGLLAIPFLPETKGKPLPE